MTTFLNDDLAPADCDEQAEAMAHDALVYELSVVLMRLDGNDGDPHHLIWCGGPTPEPWGDAWQKYEEQAEDVINAIGEGSAQAMVTAFRARAALASQVVQEPRSTECLRRMIDMANESDPSRWEIGFRNIVAIVLGPRAAFEIKDVVEKVRSLAIPLAAGEPHTDGVPVVPAAGPLRELGAYLANVLDEDQWARAEALLLKAADGVETSGGKHGA